MKNHVEEKVVILTGGSSQFGIETARLLLEQGAKVVFMGRRAERLHAVQEMLQTDRLLTIEANTSMSIDWRRVAETTIDQFGRIDVLINNHGAVIQVDPIEKMTDEAIQEVCELNLIATIKGCRTVLPVMKQQGTGHIINVACACALRGWTMWGPYAAAKAGVIGFTRVLHNEMCVWGGKATSFIPGATKPDSGRPNDPSINWVDEYPSPEDFARMLVHCVDVPEHCVVEEMHVWGTRRIEAVVGEGTQ